MRLSARAPLHPELGAGASSRRCWTPSAPRTSTSCTRRSRSGCASRGLLDLPPALESEVALRRELEGLLARNTRTREALSFLGGGCWPHYVPAVVDEIVNRAEFVTAYYGETYTDHGKLQAFFEYASLIGELVELDAVSQPTYDWATAAASAIAHGRPRHGPLAGARAGVDGPRAPARRRRRLRAAAAGRGRAVRRGHRAARPRRARGGAAATTSPACTSRTRASSACSRPRRRRSSAARARRGRARHRRRRPDLARRARGAAALRRRHRLRRAAAARRAHALRRRRGRLHRDAGRGALRRRVPDVPDRPRPHGAGRVGLRRGRAGSGRRTCSAATRRTSPARRRACGRSRSRSYLSLLGPHGLAELGEGLMQRTRYAAQRLGGGRRRARAAR